MSNDPIIQKARQRLLDLEAERQELERFLLTYAKLAGASQLGHNSPAETATQPGPRRGRSAVILDAVAEILETNNRPMRLGEIFHALAARGIEITGKVPVNNLGAMLSGADRFETHPGIGWWFRGREVPGDSQLSSPERVGML